MSQPYLVDHRIVLQYLVDGLTHRFIAYTFAADDTVTPMTIEYKGSVANSWRLAAQGLCDALGYFLPTGTTFGTALYQKKTGIVWNPIDSASVTPATLSGSVNHAVQRTLVLRDAAFNDIKVIVLEGNNPAPVHFNAPYGVAGPLQNFQLQWIQNSTTHCPFNWQVSRSLHYLSGSAFIGDTIALNRKLRRRRGLA